MIQPTYAGAQLAAARIHRYLTAHSVPRKLSTGNAATIPDSATLAALIDAAFWNREEGYIPRISRAFVAQGQVDDAVAFAAPVSLEPKDLTKLAVAEGRSSPWRLAAAR
jgi:hypothetical protein